MFYNTETRKIPEFFLFLKFYLLVRVVKCEDIDAVMVTSYSIVKLNWKEYDELFYRH